MLEKFLRWVSFISMAVLLYGCFYTAVREQQNQPQWASAETIPQVYLNGDLDSLREGDGVLPITVDYQDASRTFSAFAELKIQGASSRGYEKLNYNICFYKDEQYKFKRKIDLGWGPQSKYCLKANWIDKTHARNLVTARLAAEMQERYQVMPQAANQGLVDGYPVEVYFNGDFYGLYTLNIPKTAWLLGMDNDNKSHIALMTEDWTPSASFELPAVYGPWGVVFGGESDWKIDNVNRLVSFVQTATDEEFRQEYQQYFNLDSVLHYIIMCDFAMLADNTGKNMVVSSYDSRLWYVTLYDLDSSWGADFEGENLYDYENIPSKSFSSLLLQRVVEVFGQELAQRYFSLRQDVLTKEHVMELFYDFQSQIPEETWGKERKMWPDAPGFDYSQIEEFLEVHIPVLDGYMKEKLVLPERLNEGNRDG